jgi:aryl-alcohol dehydrogenase-like predicted oxidoreductase
MELSKPPQEAQLAPSEAARSIRAAKIGLGAPRSKGEEEPESIEFALLNGCAVLETAPHFHNGRHEQAVGDALQRACTSGRVKRDEVFVLSSVGIVPELRENTIAQLGFGRMRTLLEEKFISKKVFRWDDLAGGTHVIAPTYLRHRLRQSLDAMQLDFVDCLFLEDPAMQLSTRTEEEYEERLIETFIALEEICDQGLSRVFGIASPSPADIAKLHSLAITAAKKIGRQSSRLLAFKGPLSLLNSSLVDTLSDARACGLHTFVTGILDGGNPQYQFPLELDEALEGQCDTDAAVRWAQYAPNVDTALFASRDRRHIRANLSAAAAPPPDLSVYSEMEVQP